MPRLEIIRRAGKLAARLASVAAKGAKAAVVGEVLQILVKHQIEALMQGGPRTPAPTPTTTPDQSEVTPDQSEVH